MRRNEMIVGDALGLARSMPSESVHCIVTSPPYWGLRSYLADDDPAKAAEMGAEPTLAEYVERMVALFHELRRVLRRDGVCWLNLGDSLSPGKSAGLAPKNLCLVPYRVALALQADGWYLRSHIIWHKPNPMPESVRDRPTSSHEAVFLLTRSPRYWYDSDAIREASTHADRAKDTPGTRASQPSSAVNGRRDSSGGVGYSEGGRNRRNVWTIATRPYSGSHYAVMPPALVAPCILAGCPVGGVVLDPFMGSGTVAMVAEQHGRDWIGFDLDARNAALVAERVKARSLDDALAKVDAGADPRQPGLFA